MNRIQEVVSRANTGPGESEQNSIKNQVLYQEIKKDYDFYVLLILNQYNLPKQNEAYYYLLNLLIYTVYRIDNYHIFPKLTDSIRFVNSITREKNTYRNIYVQISTLTSKYITSKKSLKALVSELAYEILDEKTKSN